MSLVQSQQAISVGIFNRVDEIPVSEEYLLDRAYLELMQAGLDQAATKRTLARNLRMVQRNLKSMGKIVSRRCREIYMNPYVKQIFI